MLTLFLGSNFELSMSGLEGILAIVGVALAVPATLEVILKVGVHIEEKVKAYKEIDQNMERFRMIGITMARGLLQTQLAVIHDALRDCNQDKDLITTLDKLFREIVQDIIRAMNFFDERYPHGKLQKMKWTMVSKKQLVSALDNFESNQNLFFQLVQYIHIGRIRPSPFKLRSEDLVVLHETPTHLPGEILPDSCILITRASYRIPGSATSGMFQLRSQFFIYCVVL